MPTSESTGNRHSPKYIAGLALAAAAILVVGIRGVATFEMKIPRDKYDPALLLETMGKEH